MRHVLGRAMHIILGCPEIAMVPSGQTSLNGFGALKKKKEEDCSYSSFVSRI